MVIMRPQNKNVERTKKLKWMRQLRDRTQHLSLVLRPQMVRTIWMRFANKTDASILVKAKR